MVRFLSFVLRLATLTFSSLFFFFFCSFILFCPTISTSKMRSALLLPFLPLVLGCNNPASHACASAYTASSSEAAAFCATFTASTVTATTGLPGFASACDFKPKHLSSACSCLDTAWTTAGTGSSNGAVSTIQYFECTSIGCLTGAIVFFRNIYSPCYH